MEGEEKAQKEKDITKLETDQGALAKKLKDAKDEFEPLKNQWATAEGQRMEDEAAAYTKQKDTDREDSKKEFDALKEEYDAIVAETESYAK